MNISINVFITYLGLVMIMFICAFACFGSTCGIYVIIVIVKLMELCVNAMHYYYYYYYGTKPYSTFELEIRKPYSIL